MSNPFERQKSSMRNVASRALRHCTIAKASLMRWGVFFPLVAIAITGYAENPASHSSKNSLKPIASAKPTKLLSASKGHLTKENNPRTIALPKAGRLKSRSVTVRGLMAKLAHQRSISTRGLAQMHAPKTISKGSKGKILAEITKYHRTKLPESQKSDLLAKAGEYAMFRAIPSVLKEETRKMITVAKQSLELGFGLAASLCKRWNRPDQSEYIFSHVLKACEGRSKGHGLEATIVLLRSFIQRLANEELQRRLHCRIGRIYYDNGEYGKVVAELANLQESPDPDSFETLAGLVKGISLIRLGDSKKAMSLLKWVAKESPNPSQRGRAAFLMGRLHLLYNRHKEAKVWLTKVVYELKDKTFSDQALELLKKME